MDMIAIIQKYIEGAPLPSAFYVRDNNLLEHRKTGLSICKISDKGLYFYRHGISGLDRSFVSIPTFKEGVHHNPNKFLKLWS